MFKRIRPSLFVAFLSLFAAVTCASASEFYQGVDHAVATYLSETSAVQVKVGVKILYGRDEKPAELLDVAAGILADHYQEPSEYWVDTLAWIVRLLGDTGEERFLPLINKVVSGSTERKLQRYAVGALENYANPAATPEGFTPVDLEQFRQKVAASLAKEKFPQDFLNSVKVGDTMAEVYEKLGKPSEVTLFNYKMHKRYAGTISLDHLNLIYRGAGEIHFNSVAGQYVVESTSAYVSPIQFDSVEANPDGNVELEAMIVRLAKQISSDVYIVQRRAIKELEYAGIDDPRVFEPLKKNIEERLKALDKGESAGEISWLIKGLAYSGNLAYEPFLLDIIDNIDNRKIERHTRTAVSLLEDYSAYNPIITNNLEHAPPGMLEAMRFFNMLSGPNPSLRLLALRRMYDIHFVDPTVLKLAARELEELGYYASTIEDLQLVALLCKYIAAFGTEEQVEIVVVLAEKADNSKVRKYAKRAL